MPDLDEEPGMPDRIAEMELRLQRMEKESSISARSRTFAGRIVPPEASTHFRAAGREQLMGIRALVDHWIRRLDDHDAGGGAGRPAEREEIQID